MATAKSKQNRESQSHWEAQMMTRGVHIGRLAVVVVLLLAGCSVDKDRDPPPPEPPQTTVATTPTQISPVTASPQNPTTATPVVSCGAGEAVNVSAPGGGNLKFPAHVRICQTAPSGTVYWLVAEPLDGSKPRGDIYPKAKVDSARTETASYTVILGDGTTRPSSRLIYVMEIPATSDAKFEALRAGNKSIAKSQLSADFRTVSNQYKSDFS
ncbi:hypothetical protein [Rhizocola hellebori]|nr:hypothetical protein [Rhizocola hellebori]